MGNEILLAVLLIVFFLALRHTVKHFKGQGGCCGGGGEVKARRKKLKGPVLGTYVVAIDGIRCENCKNRIEGRVNDIEGAACRVNRKKKTAVVAFDREIAPEEIRRAIEGIGYTVVEIHRRPRSGGAI